MQTNRQQRRAAERAASGAQFAANQANAQLSTGPTSPEGKLTVSQNRVTHGLSSQFRVLANEDPAEFQALSDSLHSEHKPTDPTETRLVDAMAQHFWRMQRALTLQDSLLEQPELDHKAFSLYLRYQTTHERSYYRAIRELATLRKEARREQIGFESQKRQQELNHAKLRLTNARAAASELDTELRSTTEVPLPREINNNLEAKLTAKAG